MEEERFKYDDEHIYNLVSQIKKVEKKCLNGTRELPVMLDHT